jgi:hypothetical protein
VKSYLKRMTIIIAQNFVVILCDYFPCLVSTGVSEWREIVSGNDLEALFHSFHICDSEPQIAFVRTSWVMDRPHKHTHHTHTVTKNPTNTHTATHTTHTLIYTLTYSQKWKPHTHSYRHHKHSTHTPHTPIMHTYTRDTNTTHKHTHNTLRTTHTQTHDTHTNTTHHP